jgi:hypothetical protein
MPCEGWPRLEEDLRRDGNGEKTEMVQLGCFLTYRNAFICLIESGRLAEIYDFRASQAPISFHADKGFQEVESHRNSSM